MKSKVQLDKNNSLNKNNSNGCVKLRLCGSTVRKTRYFKAPLSGEKTSGGPKLQNQNLVTYFFGLLLRFDTLMKNAEILQL